MKNPDWNKEEDEILIKNFLDLRLKDICKLLPQRSYNAIRGRQTFLKLCPEYKKDENFFEIPNTLNSSISGFIASDGHLSPPYIKKDGTLCTARICFGINQKDKQLLYDINNYTKSNYKIALTEKPQVFNDKRTGKVYDYIDRKASLAISKADKWHIDLVKNWNIPIGAKSLIIEPPKELNDLDCALAYIKGLIIGDGTILITKIKEEDYTKISLLGTENLLNWVKLIFEKFLNEKLNINVKKERENANIFIFQITGINATLIVNKMNSLHTLNLDRKFKTPEILTTIKKHTLKYPDFYTSRTEINNNLVQNFLTNKNILFTYNENLISIPDKKIHIKLNKIQSSNEPNNYKLKQFELYNQKQERLINIFENELILKPKIIISRLKSFLGLLKYKIYARKCEIKEINSQLKDKFLNKYHIQGKDYGTSVNLGLFYKNKLVSVMSFLKKKTCYELSRFSSIANFNIIGGASKLLTYFERQYKPNLIISFADKRWSNGNLYNTLNFKLSHSSPPKYWYFKDNDINLYHKFGFRHKRLSKKLDNYNSELTESENMKNNGWHRIFDCGLYCFKKEYGVITNP